MSNEELSTLIKDMKWEIDLEEGTCKSKLIHYKISNAKQIDLKSERISPDYPAVKNHINEIRNLAQKAITESHRWIKVK